ncbi:hypothetical protein [Rickettsia endosymbiont of Polydrusus tereticollis]|uniref:hypothetical protein n=1 Tax=Rickettsia endosymbiont of Polydrusus tereticollis TaxID=3066251 RepID=UPI003132BB08
MTYSTFFDPCSNAGLMLCCTNVKEKAVSCRDLIGIVVWIGFTLCVIPAKAGIQKKNSHPEFISGSTKKMLKRVQPDKKSLDSRFRGNDIKNSSRATTSVYPRNTDPREQWHLSYYSSFKN